MRRGRGAAVVGADCWHNDNELDHALPAPDGRRCRSNRRAAVHRVHGPAQDAGCVAQGCASAAAQAPLSHEGRTREAADRPRRVALRRAAASGAVCRPGVAVVCRVRGS